MTSDQSKYIASARAAYIDFIQKVINKRKLGNTFEMRYDMIKVIYLKKYISILYDYFSADVTDDNFFDSTKAEHIMACIASITGKPYFLKLT